MSRTVDYLPFSINTGSNVQGQSSYVIEPIRLTGHQAGVAKSAVVNKTLRQSSVMTASLANLLSEALDVDILDDGDVEALTALLQDVIMGGRTSILTAATTFYVRAGGSDNNDGLTPSSAYATPQKAWNEIFYHHNTNGQLATIDIGAGTFPGLVLISQVIGGGSLEIVGAGMGSTILNGVNANALYMDVGARASVHNMQFQSSGTVINQGINAIIYNNSLVDLRDIHFGQGTTNVPHIGCGVGSTIYAGEWNVNNTYTISASAASFAGLNKGSTMAFANCVITLAGTPNFPNGTLVSVISSSITFGNYSGYTPCAWNGGASGPRFSVDGTSSLWTGTGDVNWIPGDQPGSWVNSNLQGNYG